MDLEDYQAKVFNPHTSCEYLWDFCEGSFFKSHPYFSYNPYALQIVADYNDLEVVNSLGSFVRKYKWGCSFFFLGNVQPQFRSTLSTIHLVAVGKMQDIQHYNINPLTS